MDIVFGTSRLAKLASSKVQMQSKLGQRTADLLAQRLAEIQAADDLADLRELPGVKCHELTGNRKGQLAVSLDQPRRLILEPIAKPPPVKEDGGLDWTAVESVKIIEIVDYH